MRRDPGRTAPSGRGSPLDTARARVHRDRWTIEDSLDYELYAKAIAEFIRHKDAEPPLVISVQAPWGQGRTSLMRMVQHDLDPNHPDPLEPNRVPEPAVDKETEKKEPEPLTFGELRDEVSNPQSAHDLEKPKQIRIVWFNAWKYQSSEQIWAGLAHAILSQLPWGQAVVITSRSGGLPRASTSCRT